mmetsp:Transcript_13873/g.37214  ORF Transcript_13873/g.37214 Transcript_13873/m.37214 type:complete len:123 (+) Transcript_13873:782-1150(+)
MLPIKVSWSPLTLISASSTQQSSHWPLRVQSTRQAPRATPEHSCGLLEPKMSFECTQKQPPGEPRTSLLSRLRTLCSISAQALEFRRSACKMLYHLTILFDPPSRDVYKEECEHYTVFALAR